MKKAIKLLLILLTILVVYSSNCFSETPNDSTNILKNAFNLEKNSINSIWYYEDEYGNPFQWTLNDIIYEENEISKISFEGIYTPTNTESDTSKNTYTIDFYSLEDCINIKVFNHYYNGAVSWNIYDFESFKSSKIDFYVSNIFSELSLKYIKNTDFNNSQSKLNDSQASNLGLGKKVLLSIENDAPVNWFKYNTLHQYEYYENGVNHVSLMLLDWLYPNGFNFLLEPLHTFSEDYVLTDSSMKNIIDEYSNFSKISPSEISKDSLANSVVSGKIVVIKIDPATMNISSDSNIGNYYKSPPHYIIIKGYSLIDENEYFTVFNPYSEKGFNRYYAAEDLVSSSKSTKLPAFVIHSPNKE